MGQQQLMLVILVVIVVGVATIVAMNVLSSGATQSNKDAIRQDLLDAALSGQSIYGKPIMMGGAGQSFTIQGGGNTRLAELISISGSREGNIITNPNAIYTVQGEDDVLQIGVQPNGSSGTWTLTLQRQDSGNWLTTIIDGDDNTTTMGTEDADE